MKASILHIEGYHLKELFIELNKSFDSKSVFGAWSGYHYHPDDSYEVGPVNFKVNSEISKKKNDPFSLRYVLNIVSSGPKSKVPYTFRISLVGFFHVERTVIEKDQRQATVLLYANAPALLYAAARELLATTTARGPYPAVILPSVSFLDDAEKLVKEEEEEEMRQVPTTRRGAITAGSKKKRKRPSKAGNAG